MEEKYKFTPFETEVASFMGAKMFDAIVLGHISTEAAIGILKQLYKFLIFSLPKEAKPDLHPDFKNLIETLQKQEVEIQHLKSVIADLGEEIFALSGFKKEG
jgi:hypothetical protein